MQLTFLFIPDLLYFGFEGISNVMAASSARFTAQAMLSSPRRGPALPNQAGTYGIFTQSAYSFDSKEKTGSIHLLDLSSGEDRILVEGQMKSIAWAGSSILYLNGTSLHVSDMEGATTLVKDFNGGVDNLAVKEVSDSKVRIVVSALAKEDGSMILKEKKKKGRDSTGITGKVYDSLSAIGMNG
jgi:hypothetical protein